MLHRIAVLLPTSATDAASGVFCEAGLLTALVQEPGDLGTADDPVPAGAVRIVGFAHEREAARVAALLRERLGATATIEPFADEDWLQRFRAHHRTVNIGRRLAVAPPWSRLRPRQGRIILRIDPGLAFGTGSHASTYLCLRALLDLARQRPLGRVLDVGTGSGVLAFAALRLGARAVLGIEPDREALRAARENARLNRLERRIRLRAESASKVKGRFDLVLANLVRDLLLDSAPHLAARVAPRGIAILSGILDAQAAEVAEAWAEQGLGLVRHLRREGWSALVLASRPKAGYLGFSR